MRNLIHVGNFLALLTPLLLYGFLSTHFADEKVLGASNVRTDVDLLANQTTISAKTAFDQKTVQEIEEIPFEIEYKDNDELESGTENILEKGDAGKKIYNYLITFWFDEEIDSQLVNTEVAQPKTEVVERGTKVVWRKINTELGELKYWRKIKVWATKYDGNCEGCRGLTFSGTLVRKGVCAVDPKVISLGTNFYVEGYGMCRSEDIGGGIKGNEVDLGFEVAREAAWGAAWTNVYLLTSAPEN